MIWIIGGTSESAELVRALQGKNAFIVTVATETGKRFLPECPVRVGRLDGVTMADFIARHQIHLIVDTSHPYAFEVSENAKSAASQAGIEYIRYSRPKTDDTDAIIVKSVQSCCDYLRSVTGVVFFTTGINHIAQFQLVRNQNRFVYRVLPTVESVETCLRHQVPLKDIVAAVGPFSEDFNFAFFTEYKANLVVMKNSGKQGGTQEKLKACKKAGITPVVIERRSETGFTNLEAVIDTIQQLEKGFT